MKRFLLSVLVAVAAIGASAQTKDVTSLIKNADFTQELEGWVLEKAEPRLEFTTDENGTVAVTSKGAFALSHDVAGLDYYYIKNGVISAGYDVTTSVPYGHVSLENGSKLTIDKSGGALIKNGFKCKIGGELQIR